MTAIENPVVLVTGGSRGVGKALKGDLSAASLERRAAACADLPFPAAGDGRTVRERILRVFGRVAEQAALPGRHGCPCLAVRIELKDADHPASRVARRGEGEPAASFRTEAERGGAADPALPVDAPLRRGRRPGRRPRRADPADGGHAPGRRGVRWAGGFTHGMRHRSDR